MMTTYTISGFEGDTFTVDVSDSDLSLVNNFINHFEKTVGIPFNQVELFNDEIRLTESKSLWISISPYDEFDDVDK